MCHKIDKNFYIALANMIPSEVCKRTLCGYDDNKKCYLLNVWGKDYAIYPDKDEIKELRGNIPVINTELGLTILFYLLKAQDKNIINEWISEKDIPGGVAFFRGHHAIPSHLIAGRFGSGIGEFIKVCESFGGNRLDMADSSYFFKILPRVPVAVLLWKGDEEFPAEAKILFDRTIMDHLPIDIILALTEFICSMLTGIPIN